MKKYKIENRRICTFLIFLLIPLSGLITDVYIPSFPAMQQAIHTTKIGIQLTLSFFLVSYGISMWLVGSLVDSFGRYRLVIIALSVFILSNLLIVFFPFIGLIYLMRIIQGVAAAIIVVGKRAFLVDIYEGDKLKHYTSILTIIWSMAPISAPFIGGYLQAHLGWKGCFYFLAIYAAVCLILELIYSGEALKLFKPFRLPNLFQAYTEVLKAADFSIGVVFLGLIYSIAMIFGMSASFIVQHHFSYGPVITGYCALISGFGLFTGGILGKVLMSYSFVKKLIGGLGMALLLTIGMFITGQIVSSLVVLMVFVFLIHTMNGFNYNVYFTYCLTRFPAHAGISSGLTSGGSYLVTSLVSSLVVHWIPVTAQSSLALAYLPVLVLIIPLILFLVRTLKRHSANFQALH